jgi:uncharacterized protein YhaN
MRLMQLDLRAFGHFTDRVVDLSSGQHGLHIIHGPNEAGKSTALEAINCLFYGFPHKVEYDFAHGSNDLRVGAKFSNSDGEELTAFRKRGRKKTLLGFDGKLLPDTALDSYLQGLDEALFRTLFGIGYESLVSGGREILNAEGDVGETLFAAGAGADVKRVLDSLRDEAEGLYAPRAQNPPINSLRRSYLDAKETVKKTSVLPKEWHDLESELAALDQQRGVYRNRIVEITTERKALGRIQKAIPVVHERDDLLDGIAILSKNPTSILNHAESIERLHEDLGQYRTAYTDRPGLVAERDDFHSRALHDLRSIYPAKSLDDIDSVRTSDTQRRDIRTLINTHAQVQQEANRTQEQLSDIDTLIDTSRDELAALPPLRDASALRRTVTDIQGRGNLDAQRGDRTTERNTALAEANSELAKLPGWSGTLEELAAGSPPKSQAIDEFEDRLSDAVDETGRLGERLSESEQIASRSWPLYITVGSALLAVLTGATAIWYGPIPLIVAAFLVAIGIGMLAFQRKWKDDAREALKTHDEAVQRRADIDIDWRAAWSGSVPDPATPRDMRDWLLIRDRVLLVARRTSEIDGEIQQIDEHMKNGRDRLETLLGELDENVNPAQPFGAVLMHCEDVLTQIEEDALVRRDVERRLGERVSQHDALEAVSEKATVALSEWLTAWSNAVTPLQIHPEPSPDDAATALEMLESAYAHLENAENLNRRITQIVQTLTDFDERVRTHADLLHLPGDESSEQIAGLLYRTLNELKTLTSDGDNCDARIRDIAEGTDIAGFIESCRESDPGALEAKQSELGYEESELEPKLAAVTEEIGEKRQVQRGYDGGSEAAEAEQAAQTVIASLRGHVERYAELRMAEYLLQRAIEQYRKENEGPVLAHATEAFAALTCGSFISLRPDYDEKDQPTLRGVRQSGESLDVEAMSEGTVDQLYLALRIGALEHYLSNNEPMPFIADDVLVKFDDRRTAAAMRLFADLSDRTQVLYFTHHESVVEAARAIEAENPGRVFIQDLSDTAV